MADEQQKQGGEAPRATIKVFVARLMEAPLEITLPEGARVADALREANISVREVAVNGLEATMHTVLHDGDYIAAVPKQVDGGR